MKVNLKPFWLLVAAIIFFNSQLQLCEIFCAQSLEKFNEKNICISTPEDLLYLEKKCRLDTWSKDKTIILENDIDLSHTKFKTLPYFSGVLDGHLHKIKLPAFTDCADTLGFIRYTDKSAIVKNLKIYSIVSPSGSGKNIGGIVGKNSGIIKNCSHDGIIKAKSYVGGICAINETEGEIVNCHSYGKIYGEHYVGGISGENFGQIISCNNNAYINNKSVDTKIDVTKIKINSLKDLASTENFSDITDVGGISGFSTGIIQTCKNNSQIGHIHIGYNIGGIVGRQICYVNGCTNNGQVFGRKDIGGICGQLEPYTVMNYSQDSLDNISNQLHKLQDILDTTINKAESIRKDTLSEISSARKYSDDAQKYVDILIDSTKDYTDKNFDAINVTTASISELTNSIVPELKNLSLLARNITKISREYKKAFDYLEQAYDIVDMENITSALDKLSLALDDLCTSISDILDIIELTEDLRNDLPSFENNMRAIWESSNRLDNAFRNIINCTDNIKTILDGVVKKIMSGSFSPGKDLITLLGLLVPYFDSMHQSFLEMSYALITSKENLNTFVGYISEDNRENIKDISDKIKSSIESTKSSMENFAESTKIFSESVSQISTANEYIKKSIDCIKSNSEQLLDELDKVNSSMEVMINALDKFSKVPALTLTKIDDEFIENKNKLLEAVSGMANTIFNLSDQLNLKQDELDLDISNLSTQIFQVFDSVIEAVDNAKNKSLNPKDYIEDISDTDKPNNINGKINGCINKNLVNGDLNVGGIVGTMAIEYDFDPEDDIIKNGNKSSNFLFQTRAIVNDCKNLGKVSCKKNYVGGVVGKSDLGAITNCFSSGYITSTDDDYVGGIAGKSSFLIKNCWAKSVLSGENYVGGICGEGHNIFSSNSIPYIKNGKEHIGAITGFSDGDCKNCHSVCDKFGCIDDVDYDQKAKTIDYNNFVLLDGIPEDMRYCNITFLVYGKVLAKFKINFAENFPAAKIPEVPPKDGYYGQWDKNVSGKIKHDYTVNAVYSNYICAIESKEKNNLGKPIFIAEGKFNQNSKIDIYKSDNMQWELKFKNVPKQDNIKLHYLNDDKHKPKIKIYYDNKWHRANYKKDGDYLIFDVPADKIKLSIRDRFCLPWSAYKK